jgi:serine/threonine-protein kinase
VQLGTVVAERYRISRILGRGGMAVVYQARDERSGAEVALKIVRRSQDRVDRFVREVQAAARLQSPYVCALLDVGTVDEGRSYLVMPLLHGMPLRKLLDQTPILPLPLALSIADQVLAALDAAHAAGIVHRDLKPENVFLLDESGRDFVKVLDFGIARVEGDSGAPATATGQAIGTAQYMAPEQARGQKDQDARVDIWAAGVLMYEMVTGARPFDGESYGETLAHVLFDPFSSPRVRRPELPVDVERLILTALQRDRDLRYPDAQTMRNALSFVQGARASAPPDEGTDPEGVSVLEQAGDHSDSEPTIRQSVLHRFGVGQLTPPDGLDTGDFGAELPAQDLDGTPPDGTFLPDDPTRTEVDSVPFDLPIPPRRR